MKVLSNEQTLLMQGQQGPCQDAICSVPACLWPQAMTLGDGSALGPMPHSSCPQNLLLVRSEIRHLFCEKKFLSVSLRGKKRQDLGCQYSRPRWVRAAFSLVPPGRVSGLIYSCRTSCSCHTRAGLIVLLGPGETFLTYQWISVGWGVCKPLHNCKQWCKRPVFLGSSGDWVLLRSVL